jgi:hypothetical protein
MEGIMMWSDQAVMKAIMHAWKHHGGSSSLSSDASHLAKSLEFCRPDKVTASGLLFHDLTGLENIATHDRYDVTLALERNEHK